MPRIQTLLAVGATLAATLACTGDSDSDTDLVFETDTGMPEADGCPLGTARASAAGVDFSNLTLDGIYQGAAFDANVVFNGVPAACIAPDSSAVYLRFETVNGEGRLELHKNIIGSYELSEAGTLVLVNDGTTAATFSGDAWTLGNADITSVNPYEVFINGSAFADGVNLGMMVTITVTP